MMDAVPLVAAELTVKLGVESPSLLSVKARVPVMEVSPSAPEPEVSPEKEPSSLTALRVRLMVWVSSWPSSSVTVTVKESEPLKSVSGS